MFESLVSQVAGRFGLSDEKTKQLLGMLIGLVFNEQRGGPAGFLNLFREKGLGDVVASWLGNGDNLPINGSQISNVLGADIINSFGNKLGLPGAVVSDASAALLPTVISTLAHDGNLDVSAWDRAKGWFGGLIDGVDNTVDGARAAAVGAAGAVGAGAAAAANAVTRDRDTTVRTAPAAAPVKSSGGMWKWLLPLLALLAAFLIFRSCSNQPASTEAAPEAPAAEAAATDANAAATDAANAAGDAAAGAADAAAAAAKAAEEKARAALGALTADSSVADYKAALDLVPIQFDTAKATIKAESNAILDEAANTIKKMKAGTKVEIQGYTDSDGDDAANMKLSQDRADSVKAALVQRGVSADMLSTKGFGETNPIASNDTAEGKAQNRRIAYDVK